MSKLAVNDQSPKWVLNGLQNSRDYQIKVTHPSVCGAGTVVSHATSAGNAKFSTPKRSWAFGKWSGRYTPLTVNYWKICPICGRVSFHSRLPGSMPEWCTSCADINVHLNNTLDEKVAVRRKDGKAITISNSRGIASNDHTLHGSFLFLTLTMIDNGCLVLTRGNGVPRYSSFAFLCKRQRGCVLFHTNSDYIKIVNEEYVSLFSEQFADFVSMNGNLDLMALIVYGDSTPVSVGASVRTNRLLTDVIYDSRLRSVSFDINQEITLVTAYVVPEYASYFRDTEWR